MFQDEARFGRMSSPVPAWAPPGVRPLVGLALVREFVYAYAAVSPLDGNLSTMVAQRRDTATMNRFLAHVSRTHPGDHIVMVLDGAPSHRARGLAMPDDMSFIPLPPYSPELNPAELLWDDLREKEFANRVFDSLPAATEQLRSGLRRLQRSPAALSSLTGWDWIISSL